MQLQDHHYTTQRHCVAARDSVLSLYLFPPIPDSSVFVSVYIYISPPSQYFDGAGIAALIQYNMMHRSNCCSGSAALMSSEHLPQRRSLAFTCKRCVKL